MANKNYIILECWDRFDLVEEVNDKIDEGYVVHGELIYKSSRELGLNHGIYIQAMILKNNEQNKEIL